MLKRFFHCIVPGALRRRIREKNPYYRQLQEFRQETDAAIAEYRSLLANARQQCREKEDAIKKLDAEYRVLLTDARQQCQEKEEQLKKQAETIDAINEKWRGELLSARQSYRNSLKMLTDNPGAIPEQKCRICGGKIEYDFSRKVLNKYDVSYFYCGNCEHIQTEKPYWLTEAYQFPLSDSDTGQIWRNERNCRITLALLQRFFPSAAKVLEYAGAYGLLTRMLRDAGAQCYWYDKYAANTFARHFEDNGKRGYDLTVSFEALEHFEDPMWEFETIFNKSDSLLFSEELLPNSCPASWWYLCCEHGQHVNFYSPKTFQYIADHFHKKLYLHGDIGLMTSLEIDPAEFEEFFVHIDELALKFRVAHPSLMEEDMNFVIRKMEK